MKIGLFFGSFNPIHVGHTVIANYMLEFTDLDRIWFIVSPHNPHKEKRSLLADEHRLQMVQQAIGDNKKMKVSNVEFSLPQPSYTVNTLAYFKKKYPKNRFVLIIGSDNLTTFHKWKNYEKILKNFYLYVYPRLGNNGGDLAKHPHVKIIDAPVIDISSTFIREAIKKKKDVRYLMPEAVSKCVKKMQFYKK